MIRMRERRRVPGNAVCEAFSAVGISLILRLSCSSCRVTRCSLIKVSSNSAAIVSDAAGGVGPGDDAFRARFFLTNYPRTASLFPMYFVLLYPRELPKD